MESWNKESRYRAIIWRCASQRLAISRALVANALIKLLDEPTSSLNLKSEVHIVKMLGMLVKQGKTVVVFAHRLQTLSLAHNVVHQSNR